MAPRGAARSRVPLDGSGAILIGSAWVPSRARMRADVEGAPLRESTTVFENSTACAPRTELRFVVRPGSTAVVPRSRGGAAAEMDPSCTRRPFVYLGVDHGARQLFVTALA